MIHSLLFEKGGIARFDVFDFVSYIATAVSSTLFSRAVSSIGWGNLVLIWSAIMAVGVAVSIPRKFAIHNKKKDRECIAFSVLLTYHLSLKNSVLLPYR